MIASLEAGSVDLVRTPPLTDVDRLKSDAKYQFYVHDHAGVNLGLGFSTYSPPLDDRRVRQALNYAVDRKRWNDTALSGLGRPTDVPWLPTSPAYEAEKDTHYTFDLDKAKSLLDDSWIAVVSPAVIGYLLSAKVHNLTPNWHNSVSYTGVWLDA